MKTIKLTEDIIFYDDIRNVPEVKIEKKIFNDGTPYVKILEEVDYGIVIGVKIKSFEDIGYLCCLVEALKLNTKTISLYAPYIIGFREDRKNKTNTNALTVKVVADIINSLGFDQVLTLDAHSNVGPALINNCINLNSNTFISKVIKKIKTNDLSLVSPDIGAVKKIQNFIDEQELLNELVICNKIKVKDKIINYNIVSGEVRQDCLIIDDIADSLSTAINCAEILKEKGAKNIYGFFTHSILSDKNNYQKLNNLFTKIFTTNSYISKPPIELKNLIKIFKI